MTKMQEHNKEMMTEKAVIKKRLLLDLFTAYYDARKNKRNTINQLRFEINYEANLIQLCNDIFKREYEISPSICFIVNHPVKREIFAADFRDRVIHHLIYNYINPFYEEQFIEDSYSCRKGKGTHYAIKRLDSFIDECSDHYTRDCYILKLDLQGYFMNIDRGLLLNMIESFIASIDGKKLHIDKELLLYLIRCVLNDDPTEKCTIKGQKNDWIGLPPSKSLFHTPRGHGLPIGNLTSQLFSNVFLHVLDNHIKNELGIKYYGRYVDDFFIVHNDIDYLKQLKNHLTEYVKTELLLTIHPNKIYLQHYTKGVSFLGAVIKPHRLYVSNRSKKQFHNSLDWWEYHLRGKKPSHSEIQKMAASLNSYLGVLGHYRAYNIKKNALLHKSLELYKYGYIYVKPQQKMKYILKKETTQSA